MGLAHHIVNADNDLVRVTTWTFGAAGAATGQHRHEFDQVAGSPYLGTAGTAHDVISAAAQEAVFVEIELKR